MLSAIGEHISIWEIIYTKTTSLVLLAIGRTETGGTPLLTGFPLLTRATFLERVARFLFALIAARGQLVGVGVLLGTHGAIHEFAVTFRLGVVSTERTVRALVHREPTTQTGVFDVSALATVVEFAAANRAFELVDHVEESAEVALGEVVADALENVQDLVVGDLAVVVSVGLFVECLHCLHDRHPCFGVDSSALALRWLLLQHTREEDTWGSSALGSGILKLSGGVAEMVATVLAKTTKVFLRGLLAVCRFLVVASQCRTFGGAVHGVDRLLSQHGGDLVPH